MKKLNHWIHSVVDRKLLKFVAVGIVNTVVGTAIMFGLYNLAGCSYWVSSATNYTLTSILSFFLNKFFTFQNRQKSPAQVLRFAGNILVCYLVAYGAAKPRCCGPWPEPERRCRRTWLWWWGCACSPG